MHWLLRFIPRLITRKKGICISLALSITGCIFVLTGMTTPWAEVDLNVQFPVMSFDVYLMTVEVSAETGLPNFIRSVLWNIPKLRHYIENLKEGSYSIDDLRDGVCSFRDEGFFALDWLSVICSSLSSELWAGIVVIVIIVSAGVLEFIACCLLLYYGFVSPKEEYRKMCIRLYVIAPSLLLVAVLTYVGANSFFQSFDLIHGVDLDVEQGQGIEMIVPALVCFYMIPCLSSHWEMKVCEAQRWARAQRKVEELDRLRIDPFYEHSWMDEGLRDNHCL